MEKKYQDFKDNSIKKGEHNPMKSTDMINPTCVENIQETGSSENQDFSVREIKLKRPDGGFFGSP